MPAHATSVSAILAEGSQLHVPVPGQGPPVVLFDGRPKLRWTEEEIRQAAERQQQKAGALVALVRERTEEMWAEIRRELNEAAGGQASARVMVLAHHAMRAHQALELQTMLAEVAAGDHGEGRKADPNNGLRNQSGLSVIATQALNQAYEAARAEHKANQGNPTQQLLGRLGHGAPIQTGGSEATHGSSPTAAEGPTPVPPTTGGVGSLEAPPSVLHPPFPTFPGGCR